MVRGPQEAVAQQLPHCVEAFKSNVLLSMDGMWCAEKLDEAPEALAALDQPFCFDVHGHVMGKIRREIQSHSVWQRKEMEKQDLKVAPASYRPAIAGLIMTTLKGQYPDLFQNIKVAEKSGNWWFA